MSLAVRKEVVCRLTRSVDRNPAPMRPIRPAKVNQRRAGIAGHADSRIETDQVDERQQAGDGTDGALATNDTMSES
jgi:hypothetical protein